MTNLLLAAKSGWGKSWHAQAWLEANLPEYDHAVILDFKDEYRGLVKEGLARYYIAGPREKSWRRANWQTLLAENKRVVLSRHDLDAEEWRDLAAHVVDAARNLDGSVLVAIDEAHFVAPQRGKLPSSIKGLATTGRGEGASSLWVTQRLAEMDETVIAQMMARILGGFESDADLAKVERVAEYPVDVHNPQVSRVSGLPDALAADAGPVPLRKFEADGQTVGSEWVYSDDSGDRERMDTRDVEMRSTHYGAEGESLRRPDYG